jgi:cyclase
MTLARRIIPCLDTDGARVVKGINFVALRDAGDPPELAAQGNAEGGRAGRSRHRRLARPSPHVSKPFARVVFIHSITAGGIRTSEDARAVVRAGADKITVNTAAVEQPRLISQLSEDRRASRILAIDAKHEAGNRGVRIRGTGFRHLDAIVWAQKGVSRCRRNSSTC